MNIPSKLMVAAVLLVGAARAHAGCGLTVTIASLRAHLTQRLKAVAALLGLSIGLAIALPPRDASAANGHALADLARSIHRMQAACDRRAQARCALLATTAVAPASPSHAATRVVVQPTGTAVDLSAAGTDATRGRRTRGAIAAP